MKIVVDTDQIDALVQDGKNIVLKPEAETALLQLLELRRQVELAIDTAKALIEVSALKYNPDFSSVRGDKVKVYYRRYGSKYKIDEPFADQLPPGLFTTKTSYQPVPEAIDAYLETQQSLPLGIIRVDRPKQISIREVGQDD